MVIDALGQVVSRTTQQDRLEKMIVTTLRRPEALIPPGELERLKKVDAVFLERFR